MTADNVLTNVVSSSFVYLTHYDTHKVSSSLRNSKQVQRLLLQTARITHQRHRVRQYHDHD